VSDTFHSSDITILDLLRRRQEATVAELAEAMEVTPTAVRQRLQRLMFQGLIRRSDRRQSRGRPTHGYSLTPTGRRKAGENFADLATALWEEVRSLEDPQIKGRLIQGIARRLARQYARQVRGDSVAERMAAVSALFGERQIPISVDGSAGEADGVSVGGASAANAAGSAERGSGRSVGPVLSVLACPYPDLTHGDDSICRMEQTLLSELIGSPLELGECTLSGGQCCRFSVAESRSETAAD